MGEVNHWGAWQIEESGLKLHVAPKMELICRELTRTFLAPALAAGGEDPDSAVVWYDLSELQVRPDRSSSTMELYDRGEASGAALRRETGADDTDKPDEAELREWAVRKLLGSPLTAPLVLGEVGLAGAAPASAPDAEGFPEAPAAEGGDRDLPGTQGEPPPPPNGDRPGERAEATT
jgi:hypothetical protein